MRSGRTMARKKGSLEALFLEAAWAAAEATSVDDLGRSALGLVAEVVGASNVLLYRYDEGGVVSGVAGTLVPALPSYVQELFELDPVQHHLMGLEPTTNVVLTLDGMDLREYRRSAAYADFYKPHDVEWLLGAWLTPLPYGAPGMSGILFTRARGEEPFDDSDVGRLARVLPGLRAVARRDALARQTEQDRSRQAAESLLAAMSSRPMCAFDAEGRLLWITPRAETLLGPRWRPRPDLDRGELSRAARALARGSHRREVPPPPSVLRLLREDGVPLRAELSIARLPSGAPFVLVSIDEPAAAVPDAVNQVAKSADLTKAETTVLAALAEGLSNPEIAARLHVSIETVRTHVARVLGKLGVKRRTEAALAVMRARGKG